jgi:hypothetical protein
VPADGDRLPRAARPGGPAPARGAQPREGRVREGPRERDAGASASVRGADLQRVRVGLPATQAALGARKPHLGLDLTPAPEIGPRAGLRDGAATRDAIDRWSPHSRAPA